MVETLCRTFTSVLATAFLLATVFFGSPVRAVPLVELARVGPWSAVSGLIGYRSRLWLVNSVKFKDHNSADIYSFDVDSNTLRYERHMFSQDTAPPIIFKDILYWPFEDGRASMGRGEFMFTNGMDWRWQVIPKAQAFHVHTMLGHNNALYAGTGAFHANLYVSLDRGLNWQHILQSKDKDGSFSRLVSLARFKGALYAGFYSSAEPGVKLRRLEGGKLVKVKGWPESDETHGLTAWRGWLYAIQEVGGVRSIVRTDGKRIEEVPGLAGKTIKAFAIGPKALWTISVEADGGALWSSSDGVNWTLAQKFTKGRPVALTIFRGQAYVGLAHEQGHGALWGPKTPLSPTLINSAPAVLPVETHSPLAGSLLTQTLTRIDAALSDKASLNSRRGLRDLFGPIVRTRLAAVGAALSTRLGKALRSNARSRFAGTTASNANKSDWQLLWGIARTGQGYVPPALLAVPWVEKRTSSEKYAAPTPGAAWAISNIGQTDPATLKALIARLGRADDPLWLKGDIVGALTAVTGKRFGYDFSVWRDWYARTPKK